MTKKQKMAIKQDLVLCLKDEKEIEKIVVFGSFLSSDDPNDLDVAIFQNSHEKYLPLATKYRKKTRSVARLIPLDIIPLKAKVEQNYFLPTINQGETVYER